MTGEPFSLATRVYIEDTDAGGIVFYANYLKYMERARTEMMRALGFARSDIFNRDLLFVVRRVELSFEAAAVLDDQLRVTAALSRVGGASMVFAQRVLRGSETLVSGSIAVACVGTESRAPRRIPRDLLATLRAQQRANSEAEN